MNPTAALKLFQCRKELYNKPFNAIIALTNDGSDGMDGYVTFLILIRSVKT